MGSMLACCAMQCCTSIASNVAGCASDAAAKSSTVGRVLYAVILLILAILAWVLRNLPSWSESITYFKWIPGFHGCSDPDPTKQLIDKVIEHLPGADLLPKISIPQQLCYGTMSVYRISATLALFHLILALVMIGVKNKKETRSDLQHTWWSVKILALVGMLVAVFFIPNIAFIGFGWIALIGSGVFILIQLILLVDFAHSWNESWVSNYAESEDHKNCWAFGLLGSTLLMYGISIALSVVMYVFFLGPNNSCSMNTTFISLNLIFNFFTALISIHPKLQEKNPRIGLLQSSVVCVYSTYLVWSALASEPELMDGIKCSSLTIGSTTSGDGFSLFFGVGVTFLALIYTALRVSSSGDSLSHSTKSAESLQQEELLQIQNDEESMDGEGEGEGEGDDDNIESTVSKHKKKKTTIQSTEFDDVDENKLDEPVDYNYSFFHFTFMLAALYLAMVLTNWETVTSLNQPEPTNGVAPPVPEGNPVYVDQGMAAVWVKVVSSWLTIALYVWTLLVPVFFPDRQFF